MTKAPSNLQDLRRRIYRKAKSDKSHRFWGLFVHITKVETLEEAYRAAKRNLVSVRGAGLQCCGRLPRRPRPGPEGPPTWRSAPHCGKPQTVGGRGGLGGRRRLRACPTIRRGARRN